MSLISSAILEPTQVRSVGLVEGHVFWATGFEFDSEQRFERDEHPDLLSVFYVDYCSPDQIRNPLHRAFQGSYPKSVTGGEGS